MRLALIVLALLLAPAGLVQAEPAPVAGTTPDRRPEGAPRIETFERDAAWWARFNFGISQPVPPNLGGEHQGAWYTPFNRRGAPPPYDLRGWHATATGAR